MRENFQLMIHFTQNQIKQLMLKTSKKVGEEYPKGYKCENFVLDAYLSIGIKCVFTDFPKLSFEDVFKEEWIGYLCFLKHKIHCPERQYTHVGIIAPEHSLLHYSRYFGEPNVREVFRTSYEDIFRVYNFS